VTYILTGTVAASATGSLANTAVVTPPALVSDTNLANNSATDTDTLTPRADLSITKTDGTASSIPGASVTYTIVASNAGPSVVNGATVTDSLPAAISGASWTCAGAAGGSCTASGSGNLNTAANLPVGASVTYTLTGTVAATATGSLANTATVAAPGGVTDPNAANNSATDTDTLTPQADLAITKTDGQSTTSVGASITYTIVASSAGPSVANGAVVADTVPGTITGVTWTCAGSGGGSCTASGSGNLNDTVNLPAGASVTYALTGTVTGSSTGNLVNTATVTAPGSVTDPNPANNSATDTDLQLCSGEHTLVGDGRTARVTVAGAATQWLLLSTHPGYSYTVEVADPRGASTPSLPELFLVKDGCVGTTTATRRDITTIDPAAPGTVRFAFTSSDPSYRLRFSNPTGAPVVYSAALVETTQFSASWTSSGSYNTYYSFQNTTDATITATLLLVKTDGTSVGTTTLTIPGGTTVATNTAALAVPRGAAGTARLTHDGPAGALVSEAAIANFGFQPAYVQPIRFRSAREGR
jgi:uncharacterized repeat protein (TIGR01451 family)